MSIHAMSWRVRLLIVVLTLVVVSSVVVGVAVVRNHHASSDAASLHHAPPGEATITIERGQDSFAPFILPVKPGTIVTWKNEDGVAHIFRTTPDTQSFLNPQSFSFRVEAGQQVSFRFTRPGIYHYYETTKGTWNATYSRVSANNGLRHYPLSMEGYPYSLAGEAIPLSARLLSVVDSYDAMTSDRPYRSALSHAAAIEELQQCAGTQFDPQVVAAFLLALEKQGQIAPIALRSKQEPDPAKK